MLYQVDATVAKRRIEAISGLRHLEMLDIDVDAILIHLPDNDNTMVQDSISDAMWLKYSPADCCNVAKLLTKSCPTLHRISLQLRDDKGKASNACCFSLSGNHQMEMEGFNTIDTTSWWMT